MNPKRLAAILGLKKLSSVAGNYVAKIQHNKIRNIVYLFDIATKKLHILNMARKVKQFDLFSAVNLEKSFGASLLKNSHAKIARPISTKEAMHIVLRSSQATGAKSLLKHARAVEACIHRQARIHGIKVYRLANAGNHLHLVVKALHRKGFQNFLRALTGLIARITLKSQRGSAKVVASKTRVSESTSVNRFWDQRPFTRILNWGKDFKRAVNYLKLNTLEAMGFVPARSLVTQDAVYQQIKNLLISSHFVSS